MLVYWDAPLQVSSLAPRKKAREVTMGRVREERGGERKSARREDRIERRRKRGRPICLDYIRKSL